MYNTLSLHNCQGKVTHCFINTEIIINPHLEKVVDQRVPH